MNQIIMPKSLWSLPQLRWPAFFDDEEWPLSTFFQDGLTVSEDEKNIYVEASVPGVDPKVVDVTFDKGILWVRGEKKEEEKDKKYYRKATHSFSYRTTLPVEVERGKMPEAECKNGVITVIFKKVSATQPKKITVKSPV